MSSHWTDTFALRFMFLSVCVCVCVCVCVKGNNQRKRSGETKWKHFPSRKWKATKKYSTNCWITQCYGLKTWHTPFQLNWRGWTRNNRKEPPVNLKKKTIKYTFIWYLWLKFNFILQMHGGVKGKQLCSENRRHAALKGRSRTAYKTIKQDMPQLGW